MYRRILKFFKRKLFLKHANVAFGKNLYFEFEEKIVFQGHCHIGDGAYWSGKGGIIVGNNVIFGPFSTIWSSSHNYNSEYSIPYGKQSEDLVGVVNIEDNVWVGLGATILKGVSIGEGAIIGARALVSKDVPSCAIVAGNPAKIIGYRDRERYDTLLKENKLYLEMKSEGM